jgi:hypothetical protein
MNQTQGIPRGFTGCLSKAGLGIGSTPEEISTAAPNGAGFDYAIDGIAYHYADDASVASVPEVTLATQAADTTCLYLVQADTLGALSMVKGVEESNDDLSAGTRVLHWPEPTAGKCPIGAVKIKTVGTAFVPDVDSLAEAWVTDTYYDFLMGMPTAPLES